jgi:hypothetical protein
MRRQSAVTTVSIGYAIYGVAILSRGLLTSVVRPRGHLSPWFICAILALLAYGMVTKQRWARGLGLLVGVAGSFLWSLAIVWLYAFSGFNSRLGRDDQTLEEYGATQIAEAQVLPPKDANWFARMRFISGNFRLFGGSRTICRPCPSYTDRLTWSCARPCETEQLSRFLQSQSPNWVARSSVERETTSTGMLGELSEKPGRSWGRAMKAVRNRLSAAAFRSPL